MLLFAIITLYFLVETSFGQSTPSNTISGTVIDKETKEPLASVNIYISGSTVGTVTDKEGKFEFSTSLSGEHQVVISFISYQEQIGNLDLENSARFNLQAELEKETLNLEPVEVIESRDSEWERIFSDFRDEFIGITDFASETKIENSWVVDFTEDEENIIHVIAPEPVEVVNNALGYRIKVDINQFYWKNECNLIIDLHLLFEEMKAESDDQLASWIQNREKVYRGSVHNFFTALYNNNLRSEGFSFELPITGWEMDNRFGRNVRTPKRGSVDQLSDEDLRTLLTNSGRNALKYIGHLKGFKLPGKVDVIFNKRNSTRNTDSYRSSIWPIGENQILLVTESGELLNWRSFQISGYWSSHRLANRIPLDYMLSR